MHTLSLHIRKFACTHDDLPVFHAGYFAIAIISAGLLNLGAFGLLILAHMSLDAVKYREVHHYSAIRSVEGMLRESLLDIALFSVGTVFAVYLHHSVGIASLSGLMRAEATIVRAVALAVPKIHILHDFLKIVAHLHCYFLSVHPRMQRKLTGLEILSVAIIGISIVLIAFAAPLMSVEWGLVQRILMDELLPWRL